MARGECPRPNPECRYYPDCFSDAHHIYGKQAGGIRKEFSNLHTEQMCRSEHDELHATEGVLPLPDIETMKRIIAERK